MYCKKKKNDILKKRDQAKLENQVNSDSIKQEILNKISENFKNVNMGESSCSNRSPIYRGNPINYVQMDFSLNQGNFCESPIANLCEGKEDSSSDSVELINGNYKLNLKETILMSQKKEDKESVTIFSLKILNFKQKVMEHIKKLANIIECTIEQKKFILSKSKIILNKHISRAKRNEITIRENSNPLTNATAIIYAVLKSNKNMPKISMENLAKIAEVSQSPVGEQYKHYKNLAPKLDFDFKNAKLGGTRRILSLYLFNQLIDTRIDLSELISHLREIDTSRIALRLGEIIINANKLNSLNSYTNGETSRRLKLTSEEHNLLEKLKEKIEILQDMVTNYSDTFTKYFSDLVNIIKLIIISNKSHNIIYADFSAHHFSRFLIDKGINLFIKEDTLAKAILDIFNFLRKKYPDLFPTRIKTGEGWASNADDTGHIRKRVVGSRIKLYIMKNIFKGKYFDFVNGIAICPDCSNNGFTVNTSFPRIRSKEFHHEDIRLEGYSVNELYKFFVNDRGNPNFLRDLIKKIENESVVLKCTSHHSIINAIHFQNFKKLISWENIPKEFPYKDIFDLPAEIIHILVKTCVDNFSLPKPLPGRPIVREQNLKERRLNVRKYVIDFLKERYIIDLVHGGVCSVCEEFNTRDHLPAFEYSHLYRKSELMPEEKKKREKLTISFLYRTFTCSEIVKEMEKRYQRGGFLCPNCHRVIHKDMSIIDKIYDEPNMVKKICEDNRNTIRKHEQNLVYYRDSIKNPLKPQRDRHETFLKYLIALYEISRSKRKQEGVTRKEIKNYLRLGTKSRGIYVFENREVTRHYLKIVDGSPIKYYITEEGKRIVRLIYYFRDYYKNLSP